MPWQPPRNDRAKSAILVAGLHLLLGAALLSGFAANPLRKAGERLTTFDVLPPLPPPTPDPPAVKDDAAARDEAGAPDLQARPAPVVLPPPPVRMPTTNPLPTADESAPDTGAAPSAGAAAIPGAGRGAGGSGDGTGGGGSGGFGSGGGPASNARLLSGNLTGRDYRRIRSFGAPRGEAVLAIEVSANGRLTRCQPISGSGNPALDAELCALLGRTRWEPARDRSGQRVAVALRYVATWDRY